jgi:hypothetical protein
MEGMASKDGGESDLHISFSLLNCVSRWIFIVELVIPDNFTQRELMFVCRGAITMGFGILSFFFLSDYPITASWLTPRERKIVILTNEADRALLAEEAFSKSQIWSAFTDYRTYLWAVVYITTYIPVYSIILSLPTVVTGLGYKGTQATLMACPPYAVGFIAVLLAGYSVDRYGHRFWHYVTGIIITMVSLIVLMVAMDLKVRYGMFFLVMFMSV